MMSLIVSMSVTCEIFIKGFRLMFLPFKTNLIWVQTLMPRVLKLFFSTVPAGDNLDPEAHFSQRFRQSCHKCKHKS